MKTSAKQRIKEESGGCSDPLVLSTEFAAHFEDGRNLVEVDQDTGEARFLSLSEKDLRRERYKLQRTAGGLLGPKHRINYCHMALGHDRKHAEIRQHEEKCSLGGLAVCANVWACPVCSSRVAERRANEIRDAMAWAKGKGLKTQLLTLTTRHNATQSAAELVELVTGAWRWVTSHKTYKRPGGPRSEPGIKKRYGIQGQIKALEVTHGGSGWHPHFHIIIFSSEVMGEAAEREIFELWARAIERKGYEPPTFEHGVDLQDGSKAGEYINKYGDDGELLTRKTGDKAGSAVGWDAADEVTKGNIKKARGGNRKPFQILQDAAEGCTTSEALFIEFVEAFRGRSQLQWSPGLKAAVGIDEVTDEELAEKAGESVFLVAIPTQLWHPFASALRKRNRLASRALLLTMAERAGLEGVARYLSSFAGLSVGEARRLLVIETAVNAADRAAEAA